MRVEYKVSIYTLSPKSVLWPIIATGMLYAYIMQFQSGPDCNGNLLYFNIFL